MNYARPKLNENDLKRLEKVMPGDVFTLSADEPDAIRAEFQRVAYDDFAQKVPFPVATLMVGSIGVAARCHAGQQRFCSGRAGYSRIDQYIDRDGRSWCGADKIQCL